MSCHLGKCWHHAVVKGPSFFHANLNRIPNWFQTPSSFLQLMESNVLCACHGWALWSRRHSSFLLKHLKSRNSRFKPWVYGHRWSSMAVFVARLTLKEIKIIVWSAHFVGIFWGSLCFAQLAAVSGSGTTIATNLHQSAVGIPVDLCKPRIGSRYQSSESVVTK